MVSLFTSWKKERRYSMQPTVNLFIGTGGKHDEKAAKIYLYTLFKN